ncbi:MAG: hypothetical protein IPN79_11730 [Saprospiraceae bacterium]|nr:hypothetical protein [Saprospiraceae bacterium]
MKNKILYSSLIFLVVIILFFLPEEMTAQCPMCKMSAESNLKEGGTAGRGLNAGILFLLTLPYLIIGTLGYVWYKNRKSYDEIGEKP